MKTNLIKTGMMMAIVAMMMSFTTVAAAGNAVDDTANCTRNATFYYNCTDSSKTVCVLNEDGETLSLRSMFQYKRDAMGRLVEKQAYRWDAFDYCWKPAYRLAYTYGANENRIDYAEWNAKSKSFCNNEQQSVYYRDEMGNLLACKNDSLQEAVK